MDLPAGAAVHASASTQGKLRISDLAWAGPRRLLVDEHDDDNEARNGRKVFEIDLSAATNLTTAYATYAERSGAVTVLGKTQPLGCFLDNGSAAELAALPTPVVPAAKSLYLDLSPAGVDFPFTKPEGLTLLDGIPGVAIVNDNDFGFVQDEDSGAVTEAPEPAEELRIYAARPAVTGGGPSAAGTAAAGRTLTCEPGAFTGAGELRLTYEWLRGDAGPPGPADAPGPAGPRERRGARGSLARVRCTVVRKRRVRCTVRAPRGATRVKARRRGRTIASARVRSGVARLNLPRSARAVTLIAVDRRGRALERATLVTGRR